jgi:creatinine amidohydrolase/Fe(II)-dependent formamide hydrolase-like protein
MELRRDDGLEPCPAIRGLVHHFDELSQEGSIGYATEATAEKGRYIFRAAVEKISTQMSALARGHVLQGIRE